MNASKPRKFLVEHLSKFHYRKSAYGCVMLLRLHPREDNEQRVLEFSLHTDPVATPSSFEDVFGNTCHLFNIHREHKQIILHSRAQVATCEMPSVASHKEKDTWNRLFEIADPVRCWEYLNSSRFVYTCPALEAFAAANGIFRGTSPLSSLLETASILHATFRYEQGCTEADSPIEHILETGQGVCQDYTHVMIAVARSWGIPSRYVSGYLHLEGSPGEQIPAGASHSWGEFLLPDLGWVGIDPTNNTLADHRHIRIAVGRDYADAAPTQGTYFSDGESILEVRVTVVESDEPAPAAELRTEHATFCNATPVSRTHQTRADQ